MLFKTRFITALIIGLLAINSVIAAAVFSDVASNHPNFEAISALYDQGTIEGYDDNTFRPDKAVNRAESLKIILLGSNILVPEIQAQEVFPDVVHDVWYGKFAAKAKNLGIVKGDDTTGLFRPGDTVNLAEALKILMETNEIQAKSPSKNPYADVSSDAWFAPYFDYAKLVGLLDQSSSEDVHPDTPVNRGMLAELMYRLSNSPKADDYGKASFYGEIFHGRTTASGDVFDASSLTAAHRTYPFGTWLKVTNLENNKSVIVKVNDRGPYTNDDRIIDLSKAAFESISSLSRGVITVTVEVTNGPSEPTIETSKPNPLSANLFEATTPSCTDEIDVQYLDRNVFEDIELSTNIPNQIVEDQIVNVSGQVNTTSSYVTAFFVDENGNQTAISSPVSGGTFSLDLHFPKTGEYQLGILPGEEGTSIVEIIDVVSNDCLSETTNSGLSPLSKPTISIKDGDSKLQWQKEGYNAFQLSFIQSDHIEKVILSNVNEWQPVYKNFADFNEGALTIQLQGGHIEAQSILEEELVEWSPKTTLSTSAITHHEYIVEEDQADTNGPTKSTVSDGGFITMSFIPKISVRSEAAVILPNGNVEEIELTGDVIGPIKNSNDIDIFPPSSKPLHFQYKTKEAGLHFVEITNAEGLAAINIPIYPTGSFPLIPNQMERTERKTVNLGSDLGNLRAKFLNLVNSDRTNHGRQAITLDSQLSELAQYRADDMVQNQYFSHWDKNGLGANDIRKNFTINQVVAENLAKDITIEMAQYGLMRSAIHRANILDEDWKRVGFGISQDSDGTYVFVQLFSDDPIDINNLGELRGDVLATVNAGRQSPLTSDNTLNQLAQEWSELMADEDFFDFSTADHSLFDNIESANLNALIGTFIVGNTNFTAALDQIAENNQLKESGWKHLGVGLKQDEFGVIKITLIYSE